ncbi:MAG: DUF4412 domain-containing protein [Myxococcota bacterium]|nr:DUF4412 domain-containing protein [Myxococcota bacterium]
MLILLSLFVAAPAKAPPPFEGVLHVEATIEQVGTVKSHVLVRKNGDSRVDTVGGGVEVQVSMLRWHDQPARVVQLLHAEKQWVELTAEAVGASLPEGPPESPKPIDVKRIGRERVSGVMTEHVQLREMPSGAVIDVWLTPDVAVAGAFTLIAPEIGNDQRFGDALVRRGFGGYPMKAVSNEAGHIITVTTVKVEPKKLADEDFEVPKAYIKSAPPKAAEDAEAKPPRGEDSGSR